MSRGQVTSPCQGRRWTRSNTCCALMVAGCLLSMIWFRVNIEPSVPLGVYRLHAVSEPLPRGTLVLLPVPGSVQRWHAPWLPLLKPIAAIAGEVVCVDEDVLTIGGEAYGRVYTEAGGYRLPHMTGCLTVGEGEVFTASQGYRSLGYPLNAGHLVTSTPYREGLMALPRMRQVIDVR